MIRFLSAAALFARRRFRLRLLPTVPALFATAYPTLLRTEGNG